jgi:hypothetical protein
MDKAKRYLYFASFAGIVGKAVYSGIGFPEAFVCAILIGMEAYDKFLVRIKPLDKEKFDELNERLSSLEAKIGLSHLRR